MRNGIFQSIACCAHYYIKAGNTRVANDYLRIFKYVPKLTKKCFIHKNPIFWKKFLLAGQIIALVNDDFIDYHLFKVTPSGMNEKILKHM